VIPFNHEQERIRIRQAGKGYSEASIQGRNQAQDAPAGRGKKEAVDDMKACSKCKINKPTSEFYSDVRTKDGLKCQCKKCHNKNSKLWVLNHLEQNKNNNKLHRLNHREQYRLNYKIWKKNNHDKMKIYYQRSYQKEKATACGNLNNRMSSGISQSLKSGKSGRHWESLVGYTVHALMQHLESRFLPRMSWANRRLWHIDHIIPISRFQYQTFDDSEFKTCWSLSNLQPMWAKDNHVKHSKTMDEWLLQGFKKGVA